MPRLAGLAQKRVGGQDHRMYSILAVFLMTVAAAGMWHGGRAWFRGGRSPNWLRDSVDQKRGVWLVLILVPIVVLMGLGAVAFCVTAFELYP